MSSVGQGLTPCPVQLVNLRLMGWLGYADCRRYHIFFHIPIAFISAFVIGQTGMPSRFFAGPPVTSGFYCVFVRPGVAGRAETQAPQTSILTPARPITAALASMPGSASPKLLFTSSSIGCSAPLSSIYLQVDSHITAFIISRPAGLRSGIVF